MLQKYYKNVTKNVRHFYFLLTLTLSTVHQETPSHQQSTRRHHNNVCMTNVWHCQQSLLYLSSNHECRWLSTEPQKDVKYLLVKLWTSKNTLVCEMALQPLWMCLGPVNLHGFLLLSHHILVWQVVYLAYSSKIRHRHWLNNTQLQLVRH